LISIFAQGNCPQRERRPRRRFGARNGECHGHDQEKEKEKERGLVEVLEAADYDHHNHKAPTTPLGAASCQDVA
jgi:hypothetical protein